MHVPTTCVCKFHEEQIKNEEDMLEANIFFILNTRVLSVAIATKFTNDLLERH